MNIGEELVASYLRHIKGCDFTQQNLYTPDEQGEIDVVGINLSEKKVYICEVAIHLATGLRYVRDRHPANTWKLTRKFSKDIKYANDYFPEYEKYFMLWSPIIKSSRGNSKHNQENDIREIDATIKKEHGVSIDFVINQKFQDCLSEMMAYAESKTEELKCPVLRLFQIETALNRHLSRRKNN